MSTELALLPKLKETAKKINDVMIFVNENKMVTGFEKAFVQATAIEKIQEYLKESPEIMKAMKCLQNQKIGFLTDTPEGYKEEILSSCIIEATMKGLSVTGNQFNIIASKMYPTREGFTALLRDIPGLWYDITPALPKQDGETTYVTSIIKWRIGNEAEKVRELKFPIRVNKGMGSDAILGKSDRKCKCWLYNEVMKDTLSDGDVTQDGEAIIIESTTNKPQSESAETTTEPEKPIVYVAEEEQKRANNYIDKANNVDELETKWEYVKKNASATLRDDFYNEKKKKLTNPS